MGEIPALDSNANHMQPYPDKESELADLSYVAQGSWVMNPEPDDTTVAPSRACRSLSGVINFLLGHSPLLTKHL